MSWTGPGGRAAALCTAVVLLGTLAIPAQAAPAVAVAVPGLRIPATQDLPSPEEIAAAKSSESATADQVTRIDHILADASAAQEDGLATSLAANNAYADALVELQIRRDAAALAAAKAAAAETEQAKTRKLIGQLAGDLYRNGGMTPGLGSLMGGDGQSLQQAATLEALAASRTRAFQAAENAAAAAKSSKDAAAEADRAADDAARTADSRKADAKRADEARQQAVSDAAAQRTILVDQLATLRNTTVALESARVDALDQQRQQARLAALTAAPGNGPQPAAGLPAGGGQPAQAPAPAPAPPAGVVPAPGVPVAPPVSGPVPPAPANPAPVEPAPAPPAPAPAPVPPPAPAPAPGGSNQTAISVALGKVGAPYFYDYGGTGAYGFDCSGLVQAAFAAAGKSLPRTAAQQFAQAPMRVPLAAAQPGDLMVWGSAPGFYHVAIYLGGGRVVQALNPSSGITVTDLASMSGMQLYPYAARY